MKRFFKHNIFLLIILSLFAIGIVGLTKIESQACKTGVCYKDGISGNASWSCPCRGPSSPCTTNPMCQGHRWSGSAGTDYTPNGDAVSPTCTSQGRTASQSAVEWKFCVYCNQKHYFTPKYVPGQPVPALGHVFRQNKWSHDSTYHWITCDRGCGSYVGNNGEASRYNGYTGGNVYNKERHYETSERNGGHSWYYECGAYCGVGVLDSGYNATNVTVYYPDNITYTGYNGRERSAQSAPYLTAYAYTNNGYHVYGLHSSNGGNTVTFHHVNQTTGDRPATKNGIVIVIDGKTYTAPLCSFNTAAHGYDICANHYGRGGTVYSGLSADVEYNFVTVNYRTGYYGDEILRTRYVDTTQTLTTENYTLIPNRQGYDVADNGWFTSYANTYLVNTSFCNHNSGYDNYKTKHRMHFVEDYGRMYRFNTNYGSTYYNDAVATTAYTTRDLYPRWRAHALVVNYDTNGGTNKPASQTMYYSDGKSYNEQGRPTKYNLTQTVPTRAGYTFMGWGNAARWDNCTSGTKAYDVYGELNSQTRYAYSASPQAGYYEDYNGMQTRSTTMTAQAWAAFGGQDLRTSDRTITLYAQWERVIRYAFYHYNDKENSAYYTVSNGFRDVNYATVAFHNSDAEYLYMDILANDTNSSIVSKHGKNTTSQKNIETAVSFNYSKDWQARGFAKVDSTNAKIDNGNLDVNSILPLNSVYDKSNFFTGKNTYWNDTKQHTSWNKTSCHDVSNINVNEKLYHVTNGNTNTGTATSIQNSGAPDSFVYSTNYPTRYIKIYPGYEQTASYYLSYERVVKVTYHDYGDDTKHNGESYDKEQNKDPEHKESTEHMDKQTVYLNASGIATTATFNSHNECEMYYTESSASGQGQKEHWARMGWVSSIANGKNEYVRDDIDATNKVYNNPAFKSSGYVEPDFIKEKTNFKTNRDIDFYGLYYKDVTTTYDLNGGNGVKAGKNTRYSTGSSYSNGSSFTYRRYANAGHNSGVNKYNYLQEKADPSLSCVEFYLELPYWTNTGNEKDLAVYDFYGWTYDKEKPNTHKSYLNRVIGGAENRHSTFDVSGTGRKYWFGTSFNNGTNYYVDSKSGLDLYYGTGAQNNGTGDYYYTPLVSNTIYASWGNETSVDPYDPTNPDSPTPNPGKDEPDEPNDNRLWTPVVTIRKTAEWCNQESDNINVDYDNKQDINIDGIARVTVTVNIKNANNGLTYPEDLTIYDYYNTDNWDYYTDNTKDSTTGKNRTLSVSNCTIPSSSQLPSNKTNGVIIAKTNSSAGKDSFTITYTYYLQLHEDLWDVEDVTREYTNKMEYLNDYLNSLVNPEEKPNSWMVNPNSTHYAKNEAARKQYVFAEYTVKSNDEVSANKYFVSTDINGVKQARASVVGATPYVLMRQVNWRPTSQDLNGSGNDGLSIQTSTNVYHNIGASFDKTYFVQYNNRTKNTDDNKYSTFDIFSNASLRRSYNYYNVSDMLLDIYGDKTNQVIDSSIPVNTISGNASNTVKDVTNDKVAKGYEKVEYVKPSSAINTRGSVTIYYNTKKYSMQILQSIPNAHLDNIVTTYNFTANKIAGNKINVDNYVFNRVDERTPGTEYGSWNKSERYVDAIYTKASAGSTTYEYKYGAVTSVTTLYATNKDGATFDIYPFIRTTNTKTNAQFESVRKSDSANTSDYNLLDPKHLNITIDATNPIIYPDDRILTKRNETNEEWVTSWLDADGKEVGSQKFDGTVSDGYTYDGERSDGYMDINLVDKQTDSSPKQHTLTFKFEDKVSGINSPEADTKDWISASNENVQVKLERVGTAPGEAKVLYDTTNTNVAADNHYKDKLNVLQQNPVNGNLVKISYDSTLTMNKTGSVNVILDPNNEDELGHLKLTIRVYDNVSNWTEKVYDLYVFCLTGEISKSTVVPSYNPDEDNTNISNGLQGIVNSDAGGFVDRLLVEFDSKIVDLYNKEASVRSSFSGAHSINGDYPHDDYNTLSAGTTSVGSVKAYGTDKFILPPSDQVVHWGYTSNRLGGVKLSVIDTSVIYGQEPETITVDNDILKENLSALIDNFASNKQTQSVKTDTACVIGTKLYTYPTYSGSSISSYKHVYELDPDSGMSYNGKVYPTSIILDGNTQVLITYTNTSMGYVASVPATTEETTLVGSYKTSWVNVVDNDGKTYARRINSHYFYVPLETPFASKSNPHYVKLTSYKDSEKKFNHYVSIRLSWYNTGRPTVDDLITTIDDN